MLLTARRADWPRAAAATLKLGELPRAAARELLCRERAELLGIPLEKLCADPAAGAICEQLGDLALAIHMAAAYLAQRPYLPLAAFLAELQAQPLDHAALATLDDTSPTEHLQHVAQTIELSYALLTDDRRPTTDDRRPTMALSQLKTQNSKLRTRSPGRSSTWRRTARPPSRSRWSCCGGRPRTENREQRTRRTRPPAMI